MPSKRAAGKVRLVRPRKSLEINKSWEICSFPRTFEISRHLVNREKSFPRRRNGVLACPEKVVRLYIGLANRRRLYRRPRRFHLLQILRQRSADAHPPRGAGGIT